MASKVSIDDELIADINIVPFVDIILVVLIIFMVTAPMITQNSLDINLSKASTASKLKDAQINVGISAEGKIQLNGKNVTSEELSFNIEAFKQKQQHARAIISADKNVPHGLVVTVIDAIKSGGVDNFAIMVGSK